MGNIKIFVFGENVCHKIGRVKMHGHAICLGNVHRGLMCNTSEFSDLFVFENRPSKRSTLKACEKLVVESKGLIAVVTVKYNFSVVIVR